MRILFTALVLIIANYATAQQVNPVPDYVFSNRMSVGRNAVTDTAAYFSIGPRYGANKGFMPPIVGDTAHVTASNKRNGLLIFSVQKNKFLYWDSVRVRWSDMAGSSGSYIVAGDTATMLTPYVRHAGYGLTKSSQSFLVDTAAIATRARVQKGIDSVAGLSRITGSGTTNYLPKFTGSTALGNSVIYDDGSNIGIGTTTPGNKLQVIGSTRLNGWTFGTDNSVTPTDTTGALYFRNGTTNALSYSISYVRDLGTTPSLAFQNSASPGTSMFLANNYIKYMNGASTTMLLNSNNEVQIGSNTDLGDYKLQVLGNSFMQTTSGNATFTIQSLSTQSPFIEYKRGTSQTWWVGNGVNADNNFAWYDQTNNAFRMTLTNGGNLGIGTTSPTSYSGFTVLNINATTNGGVIDFSTNNVRQASIYTGSSGNDFNINSVASIPMRFYIGNVEQMRLNTSGELLIGSTTDAGAYALQVAGSIYNTTGASFAVSSGDIGIGTTSPSAKLENYTSSGTKPSLGDIFNAYTIISGASRTGTATVGGAYATTLVLASNTDAVSANSGASIGFQAKWNTGLYSSQAQFSSIFGGKENSTDGSLAGYLSFATRPDSGNPTERIRIHSNGGLKFVPQSAAPTAEAGTVYYDSDDNKLKVYNGTTWVDLH